MVNLINNAPAMKQPESLSLQWDFGDGHREESIFPFSDIHPQTKEIKNVHSFFAPKSVAVIGATDRVGAVGRTIVQNLIHKECKQNHSFQVYPVNPTRSIVCGLPAFPTVEACPTPVDLAIIVIPALSVCAAVESCGKAKVPAVIVISAGFKEIGPEGSNLEKQIVQVARQYNIRLVGPNCLGIISPHSGLNATFAATNALPGNIAFLSQSGAMCTAFLDWSLKHHLGLSAFVSIGSMADVHWGDLIDYLGNDPNTRSILIYMETIGDAAHFISAARTVALYKPIIVIKAGQTAAAAQAAASHTGSLAGSHDAFLAAMRRAGVMVVDTIPELFDVALFLGKQPAPRGSRLMIVTNAGGPGVLTTDAATLEGAMIAQPEPATIAALSGFLPKAWSRANPVDVLGDASAATYQKTFEIVASDPNLDGILVILSPQSVTEPTATAHKIVEGHEAMRASGFNKPLICSWMGGSMVAEGFDFLTKHDIPTYTHPDCAAMAFAKLWNHTKCLQAMYSVPTIMADPTIWNSSRTQQAGSLLRAAAAQGRHILSENESKSLLKIYDIPVAETVVCSTVEEAMSCGAKIGFPCVLKINSETLTHKSDVGGVVLNIKSVEEIRDAWNFIKTNVEKVGAQHFQGVSVQPMLKREDGIELILGSTVDSQFGPLVLFGAGGSLVEVFKDRALAIPPLNPTLAQIQMESTKIFQALKGSQGSRFPKVNIDSLNSILCNFSQMICDLSDLVAECDINPLLALSDRFVALDARVVLHLPDVPVPSLSVRPYPQQYISSHVVDGRSLTIRPTYVSDFQAVVEFFQNCRVLLSQQKALLFASPDYARDLVLTASDCATKKILGAACITRLRGAAELRVVTSPDSVQIEMKLIECAVQIAKQEKHKRLYCVGQTNSIFLEAAMKFHGAQKDVNNNQVVTLELLK